MRKIFEVLSERERQVIGLAAIGYADKQISEELGLSIHTLRTYWDRIRTKMGGLSRPALVAAYVSEQIAGTELSFFNTLAIRGWVMDAKTWLVRASDEINELRGLRPGIPHHMKDFANGVHHEDVGEFLQQVERVRSGELPSVHTVFRGSGAEQRKTIHLTIVGVRNEIGEVERVYGMRTVLHDCRPDSAPKLRFGRFERRAGEQRYTIDQGLAEIIGKPDKSTLSEAELFAMVPGALEKPETTVRFRNHEGRLLWARMWRTEVPNGQGAHDVHGFVAVTD
jgi:DNA-binding CsgD family transcriptional regulator